MSDLPEPLTPPDCDLQDFPFMPLHVARLRDSDLANEECAEACWYAVLLWAASWHQLPAGSLPDNDAVLTKLIGLGRDLRTFRKHKAAALRNFVLCSDGRLYHPIVAEQAMTAWQGKLQQRWRTECARIKKLNQRHDTAIPLPAFEEFMSPTYDAPSPHSVPEDSSKSPPGQCIQEKEKGTGIIEEDADASFVGKAKSKPKARTYPEGFEQAWKLYPHHEGRSSKPDSLAAWKALPADERDSLPGAIDRFRPAIKDAHGDGGAPAMERWLKRGLHLNYASQATLLDQGQAFAGPPELRQWIVAAASETFAVSYLDPASYRAADRVIEARTAFAADKIRSECSAVLARAKVTVEVQTQEQFSSDRSAA